MREASDDAKDFTADWTEFWTNKLKDADPETIKATMEVAQNPLLRGVFYWLWLRGQNRGLAFATKRMGSAMRSH